MTRTSINVLVVDDSAVVRQTLCELLSRERDFVALSAADPIIAMNKMKRVRPDVIVLDLEMPRMDGLTFLRKLMADDPIPVVICSALAGGSADAAIRALEAGAVEIVQKAGLGVRDFLLDSSVRIIDAVRAAAQSRPRAGEKVWAPTGNGGSPPRRGLPGLAATSNKVVAVGASTGGTEALRALLAAMPPDAPGIVVVQHMPEGFTAAFARRLDGLCRIDVKEAMAGDRVRNGRALIAPGNRHLVLRRSGSRYVVQVVEGPRVSRHRPSVDVLFRSVARCAGANAIGVIMTGMGADGAEGLAEMREAGALTLAQDEASSVVFGMPKEALARGAVDRMVPLSMLATEILEGASASILRSVLG